MAGTPIDPSCLFNTVTPSDTVVLKDSNNNNQRTKAISFGVIGDLAIRDLNGNKVVIPSGALAVGVMHPIQTDLIYSTGTTATNIMAYF